MLQKLCPILAGFFLASPFYIVAQNLDPLAFIKTDGVVFSVKAAGNYLYFAEYRRSPSAPASHSFFKSVDVSNPIQPVVVDSFMASGTILDFDLNGNYAYLAMADNEFGIRILDISAPADIKEIRFIEGTEGVGMFYQDDILYSADGGGLRVYDVAKPDTLKLVWRYFTNNTDGIEAYVQGNLIYLAVFQEGLAILSKTTQTLLGTFASPEIGFGVAAAGNYAYITDAISGFTAVDASQPAQPIRADTLAGTQFGGGVAIAGQFAFWADGENGLRVVDLTDPTNLTEKEKFAPNGVFAVRVALQDRLIYLASGDVLEQGTGIINGVHILHNDFASAVSHSTPQTMPSFVLHQNYPNPARSPFNPGTTFRFSVPQRSHVALKIFDLNGREVANLIDRWLDAGEHQVRWNAAGRANGIYLYRLQVVDPAHGGAGGRVETQKLILLQ